MQTFKVSELIIFYNVQLLFADMNETTKISVFCVTRSEGISWCCITDCEQRNQ